MKKKWIVLLFAILALGFTACLKIGGDDFRIFPVQQVVVATQNDTAYLMCLYGKLLAPKLDSKYKHGDCLLASYTVYYTSTYPLEASDIKVFDLVDQKSVEVSELVEVGDDYTFPITDAIADDYAPCFEGKALIYTQVLVKKNTNLDYQLTLVRKSSPEYEFDAYLTAKLVSDGTGTAESRVDYRAFDFKVPILNYGRELVSADKVVYQEIQVNLYFFAGGTATEPDWKFVRTCQYSLFK